MDSFLGTETLIIELLLIASLVAIVVRRLQVPYTVALVVVGLLLTAQTAFRLELTPELILALFVPPLVFEGAFHLRFNELRNNLAIILLFAVPGVILTTLLVGGVLSLGLGISLPLALVFGSLIAATDPVAVVAMFRTLGIPKRLAVLVEGESLLNDGTALVVFHLMLGIALSGAFNPLKSVADFVQVSAGGIGVGLALGWALSRVIARIDDYLIEITLTTVMAYGSYLMAEQFHFSGVLAVVAAGLVCGNIGPQGMSPTTRIVLFNFWEYMTFLVNSLVFLLIGLEVDLPAMLAAWRPILWAVGSVLLARALVIYGLSLFTRRMRDPLPLRWQHVLTWGGLRGALSLALALSLPVTFGEDRFLMRTMAFGVVLFTLLVQATTIRPLIRRLKISTRNRAQSEYEKRHARLTALRASERHLQRLVQEGLISLHTWEALRPRLEEQNAMLADALREILYVEPALQTEEVDIARREILRSQRSALMGLRRDGVISEDVFEELVAEVDAMLTEEQNPFWFVPLESLPERLRSGLSERAEVAEVAIEEGAACAGKQVREVPWPQNLVLVSLRRGKEVIIPRGSTLLREGDWVTMVGDSQGLEKGRQLCRGMTDGGNIDA